MLKPLTNLQRGNVVQDKSPVVIERNPFQLAAQGELFPGQDFDLNQVTSDGLTLLHVTATHGQLLALRFLLNKGCDSNARDTRGHLAIHCASYSGHTQVVKELVARDRTMTDQVNCDGNTPLMMACHQNHCPVVQELLRSGADISRTNNSGETAYSIAVRKGHKDVQSLLEKHILHLIEGSAPSSLLE